MTNLPDAGNPAWDKFLETIELDDAAGSAADAESELSRLGIDVKKVQSKVLTAVRTAKARADLERAKSGLAAFRASMGPTAQATIPKVTFDRLKRLIAERCPSETHTAYFRKLECIAGEEDLRSFLQDLDCLDALSGEEQDGPPPTK